MGPHSSHSVGCTWLHIRLLTNDHLSGATTLLFCAGYRTSADGLGSLVALVRTRTCGAQCSFDGLFMPVVSSAVAVALVWRWIFTRILVPEQHFVDAGVAILPIG